MAGRLDVGQEAESQQTGELVEDELAQVALGEENRHHQDVQQAHRQLRSAVVGAAPDQQDDVALDRGEQQRREHLRIEEGASDQHAQGHQADGDDLDVRERD